MRHFSTTKPTIFNDGKFYHVQTMHAAWNYDCLRLFKYFSFEFGKIGPKDGQDFIGGNYATAFNFATTLPGLLKDLESIDFSFFVDAGNVWGVDYDDSIKDNSKIRSSSGLAVDWLTPIGPLSFSFAKPITKADSDRTETFRFDIGTTF